MPRRMAGRWAPESNCFRTCGALGPDEDSHLFHLHARKEKPTSLGRQNEQGDVVLFTSPWSVWMVALLGGWLLCS